MAIAQPTGGDDLESRRRSSKNDEDDLNAAALRGRTMIYKAAAKGNVEVIEWLAGKGNDVNLPNLAGTTVRFFTH